MEDRYVYPALFTEDADGIAVEFPDLPGCYTCGPDFRSALDMAKAALGLHLYGFEQDGEAVPEPTRPADLMAGLTPDQAVVMVEVWMPPIRGESIQKAVKKTLTLPRWLNDLAEQRKVNFSHLLQEALKEYLGLSGPALLRSADWPSGSPAAYSTNPSHSMVHESSPGYGHPTAKTPEHRTTPEQAPRGRR